MSEQSSPWIRDVAEAEFDRAVIEASRQQAVVVDFWAPWCGPCRALGPVLEKLVAERNGEMLLAKVNTDEAPTLAERFGISGIPAVMAFRDGRLVDSFVGVLPERQLRAFLDGLRPREADQALTAAEKATDPAEAERLYRQALDQDANLEAARLGLARLLVRQGILEEVEGLLEPLGSEGPAGEEAENLKAEAFLRLKARSFGSPEEVRRRQEADPAKAQPRYELGCVLAAEGQYPQALEMLLSAGERDPKLAAGPVREAMVKVFFALGVRHPLADDYRRKLSSLLY
jgi:putative thioredoxin